MYILDESKRMFLKYKRRLELHEERVNNKRRKIHQNKDKQDEDEVIIIYNKECINNSMKFIDFIN